MINRFSFLAIAVMLVLTSCQQTSTTRKVEDDKYADQKAVVKEFIHTTSYTYMRVERNGAEIWIAVDKTEIDKGDVIYFIEGLEMNNFESTELGRTFDRVFFVQQFSDKPIEMSNPHGEMSGGMMGSTPMKPSITRVEVEIDQPEGGVTIADLYSKRNDYNGKSVLVRGKVTKVNLSIMGRNWVHIQDGTADGDNFDLTITTNAEPKVGDVVTFSGVLSLDKDFGSGYFYSLIVEEAVAVLPETVR